MPLSLKFKKPFNLVIIAAMVISSIIGCKKDSTPSVEIKPAPKPTSVHLSDSIYFEVNGKSYAANTINSNGMGNSGVNMKFSDRVESGMKNWGMVKGKYFNSSADSIFVDYSKSFPNSSGNGRFTVAFAKGYHVRDLNKVGVVWYPKDIRDMLKTGKREFAIDYRNTNTINGVYLAMSNFGGSGMPEFSFDDSTDAYNQDDATFEVIKAEQVTEDTYRIEAKFEVNLYDSNRNKTRVNKGFLRLNVNKVFLGSAPIF